MLSVAESEHELGLPQNSFLQPDTSAPQIKHRQTPRPLTSPRPVSLTPVRLTLRRKVRRGNILKPISSLCGHLASSRGHVNAPSDSSRFSKRLLYYAEGNVSSRRTASISRERNACLCVWHYTCASVWTYFSMGLVLNSKVFNNYPIINKA